MARRHIHLLSSRLGNTVVYMRKHVMWYLHGVPGASRARAALSACVTVDDFDRVLDELLADAARIEEEDRAYRGV